MMKCEECGAEMDFVQGAEVLDAVLEQFHCPKCHDTIVYNVTNGNVRKGYIDDYYLR